MTGSSDFAGSAATYERGGHLLCDRGVDGSFFEVGRLGVIICDHGDEMKVTYAMPKDATPTEVAAAYEAATRECELMRMARPGSRE